MWTLVAYTSFTTALVGAPGASAMPFARVRDARSLARLLAFVFADTFLLMLPLSVGWSVGRWNWGVKALSVCCSLLAIGLLGLDRAESGLRWPPTRAARSWSVVGVVVASALVVPFALTQIPDARPNGKPSYSKRSPPGVDEELSFRGIGLALLRRSFGGASRHRRAEVLALLVTSVWFAAIHVASIHPDGLRVAWYTVAYVLPLGFLFGLIRLRTGSLLGCVLAHNAANTTGTVLAWFGW